MGTLVLLRHGQSVWNAENLFTGWVDVPLSETGEQEARRGGELLRVEGLLPDVVHTSLLRRAIATANLALDACDRHWIPVRRDWRLNERHYGALQGKDKKQTLDTYGEEQFMLWRRSYSVPPPPIEPDSEFSQDGDPRYAGLGADMPATECLADVVARFLPYWEFAVVPDLRDGKVVLLAAHGNSLRALVKHLDSIGDDEIAGLNLPTGVPLVYELDQNLRPIRALDPGFGVSGTYLDEEAAATSIGRVSARGWPARRCLRVVVRHARLTARHPSRAAELRMCEKPGKMLRTRRLARLRELRFFACPRSSAQRCRDDHRGDAA
jgi:2,3-bisphosphoglycerate-dependent phosphoglycerate mutase